MFGTRILVLSLSKGYRHILVLVHMHDLSFHGHEKEDKKVEEQYRPKDGYVKDAKEGHNQTGQSTPRTSQPEFELGQSSGKRSVFLAFVVSPGQTGHIVVIAGRILQG